MSAKPSTRTRIFYCIAPAHNTLFATWIDAFPDAKGLINYRTDTGITAIAKEIAVELGYNPANVNPKTIFRMPIANANKSPAEVRAVIMRMNDRDDRQKNPLNFNPNSEALVFVPEVLGGLELKASIPAVTAASAAAPTSFG
ncbi:UNVERIFIED_CONTAM: hypothetical protein HDU68_004166, partial [Siphonaria sp. JEL0065]